MASPENPHNEFEVSEQAQFTLQMVARHWRDFDRDPEASPMGDELYLEAAIVSSLAELGIDRETAVDLSKIARLEAQFQIEEM